MLRWALLPLSLAATACNAGFSDFRPNAGVDAGSAPMASIDAGFVDGSAAPVASGIVSQGTWSGRRSYSASGSAEIVITEVGSVELRMSDDFSVSGVPGPFVVLSSRSSLGNTIDPNQGDIEIGPLQDNRGGQTYQIPPEAAELPFVWVFCKPFGVEVGRAQLEGQL